MAPPHGGAIKANLTKGISLTMKDIYTLGIDIGSTASKCVMLKNGAEIVAKSLISVGAGTSGPQRAIEEVLAAAGILIGFLSSNPAISSIGVCLGRGTVISIFLVMGVLPQILLLGDIIIEKTDNAPNIHLYILPLLYIIF